MLAMFTCCKQNGHTACMRGRRKEKETLSCSQQRNTAWYTPLQGWLENLQTKIGEVYKVSQSQIPTKWPNPFIMCDYIAVDISAAGSLFKLYSSQWKKVKQKWRSWVVPWELWMAPQNVSAFSVCCKTLLEIADGSFNQSSGVKIQGPRSLEVQKIKEYNWKRRDNSCEWSWKEKRKQGWKELCAETVQS